MAIGASNRDSLEVGRRRSIQKLHLIDITPISSGLCVGTLESHLEVMIDGV
jgi:hypothetical protein